MTEKTKIENLERVKAFLGGIVLTRGYGQEEYDIVCNILRDHEKNLKSGVGISVRELGVPMCVHGDCKEPILNKNFYRQGFCGKHYQEEQYTQEQQGKDKTIPHDKSAALALFNEMVQRYEIQGSFDDSEIDTIRAALMLNPPADVNISGECVKEKP